MPTGDKTAITDSDIAKAGAGASTKKMLADEKVKRCENVKDITSYISRVDEMIERKRQLFSEE